MIKYTKHIRSISFQRKKEYVYKNSEIEACYKIGDLTFSILDCNWQKYLDIVNNFIQSIINIDKYDSATIKDSLPYIEKTFYYKTAALYDEFNQKLKQENEFLYKIFSSQLILNYIASFEEKLDFVEYKEMPDFFKNNSKEYSIFCKYKSSIIQGRGNESYAACLLYDYFNNYKNTEYDFYSNDLSTNKTFNKMCAEFLIYIENSISSIISFKNELQTILEEMDLNNTTKMSAEKIMKLYKNKMYLSNNKNSYVLLNNIDLTQSYTCNNLCSLSLFELSYMIKNNIAFKKCENCDKFFVPFSKSSIYCERIYKDNKTCKEIAPKAKYNKKLEIDDATKLYYKERNNYKMRVLRNPDYYKQKKYEKWKEEKLNNLNLYRNGKITFEEFEDSLDNY